MFALGQTVGWNVSYTTLNIILPVGISFYTFQTLSYSIDIFKGDLKPTKSFLNFATFVAFFPQLVAGPIVRAKEFIFQIEKKRNFSGNDLEEGLKRFLFGFFKKAFIADTLAVNIVDPVFANPADYSVPALWMAIFAYAVQIYADFSGYSSMAIGTAKILGFNLPENFNFPYLATNISDFWRRWHMTMSRFFRDYVYITLGGSKGSQFRTNFNIAATTLISGLWHGAGWNFVIWGGLHGLYTSIYQVYRKRRKKIGNKSVKLPFVSIISSWMFTQAAVLLAWILFRTQNLSQAWLFLKGLFVSSGNETVNITLLAAMAFIGFGLDHLSGWLTENKKYDQIIIPNYVKSIVYSIIIVFLFNARPDDINPFIYFQS